MRHNFIALTLSFLILGFFNNSCRKGGRCEEASNVTQAYLALAFKDATTGKYLYAEVNPQYAKDSLIVFEPNGNRLSVFPSLNQIPNTSQRYWDISFSLYNEITDQASHTSEFCKSFLLKYRQNESDTIKACFKVKETKCGSVFETLKIYHRGILVASGTDITVIAATIPKS